MIKRAASLVEAVTTYLFPYLHRVSASPGGPQRYIPYWSVAGAIGPAEWTVPKTAKPLPKLLNDAAGGIGNEGAPRILPAEPGPVAEDVNQRRRDFLDYLVDVAVREWMQEH